MTYYACTLPVHCHRQHVSSYINMLNCQGTEEQSHSKGGTHSCHVLPWANGNQHYVILVRFICDYLLFCPLCLFLYCKGPYASSQPRQCKWPQTPQAEAEGLHTYWTYTWGELGRGGCGLCWEGRALHWEGQLWAGKGVNISRKCLQPRACTGA
jgi:hypothetical protein